MLASLLKALQFWRKSAPPGAADRFRVSARKLRPCSVAVDCGANVGVYTLQMAESGAIVHAFEPNPAAFAVLKDAVAGRPNVILHQRAVAAEAGEVRLFLHRNAHEDPVKWSTGSSLLSCKGNVDADSFVTVEAIDLAAFLSTLSAPVALLKIDIEGAEVDLLHKMIDRGLHAKIGQIFVETHDHKIPELVTGTNALRERIAKLGIRNINLDWE